ncbi:tyrosine-protein phosphatase non-receptor type 23-like [Cyclopterus lumpus]|uniref:tyrosine-protein phosphatase non-receptor type 23-like n=1 Tax=Cyclopterus lumpus TaxID=8103 RepID=UPI001485DE75|nr:tyrosine-protein phosphatase non-receptor type 23-like [Cyclopterus lumpus]
MCNRMTRKGKRKSAAVSLAVVVILMCCLAQTIDCYRLRKTERRKGRKEAEASKTIGVHEGKIVFGRVFKKGSGLESQAIDGTKKLSSNASMEDEAAYQADFAGWSEGQVQDTSSIEEWKIMSPSLHCGGDQLKFSAVGPGASQFAVEQGNASPMPLSQVPRSCGYGMQNNPLGLVLLVPYDGCNVAQEGGSYILPMRWQGIPVVLWCRKPASPSPTTAAQENQHQTPWYPQSYPHVMPPPPHVMLPSPYVPPLPYVPLPYEPPQGVPPQGVLQSTPQPNVMQRRLHFTLPMPQVYTAIPHQVQPQTYPAIPHQVQPQTYPAIPHQVQPQTYPAIPHQVQPQTYPAIPHQVQPQTYPAIPHQVQPQTYPAIPHQVQPQTYPAIPHQVQPQTYPAIPHQVQPQTYPAISHQVQPQIYTAIPHQVQPQTYTAIPHQVQPQTYPAIPHHVQPQTYPQVQPQVYPLVPQRGRDSESEILLLELYDITL